MKLVLASASLRRLSLLERIGYKPDKIIHPNIDETPKKSEKPREFSQRIATGKAFAVEVNEREVLLSADTVVSVGRRIIGKPKDVDETKNFLFLLSGRRHRVITTVVVRNISHFKIRVAESTVRFKRLSNEELEDYLLTQEWEGKAGGYAIQGHAEKFIPWIKGSHSGVVGLPLNETENLLRTFGLKPNLNHEC